MTTVRRVALFSIGGAAAFAAGVVIRLLPEVRLCKSIDCGPNFHTGAVSVFGDRTFTAAQTVVLALGIVVMSSLVTRAAWPRSTALQACATGILVLAVSIAVALPSRPGPVLPSMCPSPASGGSVQVPCLAPGAANPRTADRALVLALGLATFAAALVDRRLDRRRRAAAAGIAPRV